MLLASLMAAVMSACVKLASEHGASLASIIVLRGLPSVLLLLFWARVRRQPVITPNWRLHIWRNVAGLCSMWLGFYCVSHLPLATSASLTYTSPLFIGCWMLGWGGARRDPVRIAAVALGFLGVIVVLRPSITPDQWEPALLGLVAGMATAMAMLQLRELGRMGEPEWRTVLFFSIAVCLSSIAGLALEGWGQPDWVAYLSLLLVGTIGLLMQLAQTRAFGKGAPLLTAALQYSTIIFAMVLGVMFWDDVPDVLAWTGSGLIILAGLISAWSTARQAAPA